eukprot:m.58530 g.58530  ORF g.58530 m.58530 type:complete len:179 (-) comp11698_c0_seq5:158-694(-)
MFLKDTRTNAQAVTCMTAIRLLTLSMHCMLDQGMICGLQLLDTPQTDLTISYVATIVALALETRHIVEALNEGGHDLKCIIACGGLTKNKLYMQCHANALQIPIHVASGNAMTTGCAVGAAVAAGFYPSLTDAMATMSHISHCIDPQWDTSDFFDRKYKVYQEMIQDQLKYKRLSAFE